MNIFDPVQCDMCSTVDFWNKNFICSKWNTWLVGNENSKEFM